MTSKYYVVVAALVVMPAGLAGQERGGLDPASLREPLNASWPTYSGDYSGRRYSQLTQVTTDTVEHLSLAWTRELDTGMPALTGGAAPTFIGGEGTGEFTIGSQRIKGAILQVDDLLYVTAPDHVWALDVRDGVVACTRIPMIKPIVPPSISAAKATSLPLVSVSSTGI